MNNREIEAKFELLDPTLAAEWQTRPSLTEAFSLQPKSTVTHTDTYLDTAAYTLLRLGYTLRLRATSSGVLVTVKTLTLDGDALVHDRLELEGRVKAKANPLRMKHWPKEIRKFIQKLIETEPEWQPLCTLQQTRHKRDIVTPIEGAATLQPIAELSIDDVTVYGPDFEDGYTKSPLEQAAKPVTTFQEIEIELKPGQAQALLTPLVEVLQQQAGLQPLRTSKLERALASISSSTFDGEKYVAFIQPTMPVAEACRLLWCQQLMQILLGEAGVFNSDDSEYIHKMRVAIRRARVAARLFGAYFHPKTIRRFNKVMQHTGALLGDVRDLDVARKKLKKFQETRQDHPELKALDEHWRAARKQARYALMAWLDSKKYADFIEAFAKFCQTPGKGNNEYRFEPDETPTPYQVRHVFPRVLLERFELVRCFETLLEEGTPIPEPILHLLRIQCKYMRYSLEFADHLVGEPGEELIDLLKQLQDDLGELNDAAVSRGMLEALPEALDSSHVKNYTDTQHELLAQLRDDLTNNLQRFLSIERRSKLAQAIAQI
ncbi:MAG: CHAD domain-containing protein [Chloroflexi bacterium]|nr:CHAD domain-containing protein [Chloroflexota bacterium]